MAQPITGEVFTATALQGDTLDMICQRELGATTTIVEQALELNAGLAEIGAILPEGTIVTLPLLLSKPVAETKIIQLWD